MPFTKIKPVLLIIASNGYQPREYQIPKTFLEQHHITVVTASDKTGIATATDKSTTKIDLSLAQVSPSDYSGIFFIGGGGAMECLDNKQSYDLIMRAHALAIPYGAICISPRILAKAGALAWKRASGWNEDGKLPEILTRYDATYEPIGVVVDGTTITAQGPAVAQEFAEAILRTITEG